MTNHLVKSMQSHRNKLYGENRDKSIRIDKVRKIVGSDAIRSSNLIARVMSGLNNPTLGLEHLMEKFWGDWIRQYVLSDLNELYLMMIEKNMIEISKDIDFFYVPSNKLKIIVYPSNLNILFLWNSYSFHIRRFWNLTEDSTIDLNWYQNRSFALEYGDCRDVGYICSYKTNSGIVEKAITNHSILKIVLGCYVPSMVSKVLGREASGPWKTI